MMQADRQRHTKTYVLGTKRCVFDYKRYLFCKKDISTLSISEKSSQNRKIQKRLFKDVTDPIDVIWPCLNHVGSMFSYDLHGRRSRRSCPQRRTPACRTPFWWDAHTVGFQPFRRAHCMLGLVICFDDYRLVFQVCLDTSVVWLTLFSIDFKSGPCCPLCSAFICAFQLECFSCFFLYIEFVFILCFFRVSGYHPFWGAIRGWE